MAKLKNPLLSLGAIGRLAKDIVFTRRRRVNIAEKKPIPTDAKSPLQLEWRHMYQKAIALWHALSASEKQEWESLARRKHMTGLAWFISQALKPNPGLYLPLQGGTMSGNIDMAKHRILRLPAPIDDQEAARKMDLVAATFLALTDTPADYTGHAGKFPKVNITEDALVFALATFLGLIDTPADYTGHAGKFPKVNIGEDALIFGLPEIPEAIRTLSLTFIIDGGGSAITTGEKGYLRIPFACTINRVTMLADQSGSIVIDIWKDTYPNFPPTNADSITASAPPTISSALKSEDSTLSGWTTAIVAGNILAFNVDSITDITRLTLSLRVIKP